MNRLYHMCCVFTVVYCDIDRFYTGINIYSRQQNILITVIKSEWRNCCGVAKCGCRFMCVCSRSTYIKIGTIQRRLAWPLRKDDTQIREAFQIFLFQIPAQSRQDRHSSKVRSQCFGLNWKNPKSLRHQVFPGGPPSKYYPGPTLLNFRDQTRTGVFIVVWS